MDNKVWNILQKDKWTEKGQKDMEKLHDAIERVCGASKNNDIKILSEGINTNLYEVMDILDEYLK